MKQHYPQTMSEILWALKKNPWVTVTVILCSLITGLYSNLNALLIKNIIDHIPHSTTIIVLITAFILNHFIHNLCWRWLHWLRVKHSGPLQEKLLKTVYAKYFTPPSETSGQPTDCYMQIIRQIEHLIFYPLILICRSLSQLFIAFWSLSSMSWLLPFFLIIWLIFFIILQHTVHPKRLQYNQQHHQQRNRFFCHLTDSFRQRKSFFFCHAAMYELPVCLEHLERMQKAYINKEKHQILDHLFTYGSIAFLLAVVIWYAHRFSLTEQVTAGDIALIISTIIFLTDNSLWLKDQAEHIVTTAQTTEMYFQQLNDHNPRRFSENTATSLMRIIESLKAQPHRPTRIAIVGPSGAGKTTLALSLLHTHKNSKRKRTLYCTHDERLLERSLLNNIAMNRPFTQAQVSRSIELACCQNIIHHNPQGLQAIIGQDIRLSSGERARILIARTLLTHPDIVIYDEIMSNIDKKSAHQIWRHLNKHHSNATLVWITHENTYMKDMDKILVCHEQKVVETGHHHELLLQQGHYYSWHTSQTAGKKYATTRKTH